MFFRVLACGPGRGDVGSRPEAQQCFPAFSPPPQPLTTCPQMATVSGVVVLFYFIVVPLGYCGSKMLVLIELVTA